MRRVELDFNTEEKEYIIDNITPFSMNFSNHPDGKNKIASIFYIAQTLDHETITIYTSYLVENELDFEMCKTYPFHVENNFANFRICADIVNNTYPVYITDFNFTYDKDIDINKFSFMGKRITKDGAQEDVKFLVTSDIFVAVKYIDNYIFDGISNGYELSIASVSARYKEDPAEMIFIDKIDRIIAMAQIAKSDTCAVEFIANSREDKYSLLTTFNLGQGFNKKKFKGMNIEKINKNFLKESDQYLQIFIEYAKFANIDKEYLIIKAKNKDGIDKIFLIDSTIRVELESMIGDF